MMDLKLRKIVGWFSVFIFLGAFLFVGLAQAAGAPTTIPVGGSPSGLAVTPDGKYVYVSNGEDVAVIDTASSKVVARVAVGGWPSSGVAVSPSGEYVYALNRGRYVESVSVINVTTNKVVSTIMLGSYPADVVVSPNGQYVYVLTSAILETDELYYGYPVEKAFGVVSVIDASTNSVLSNTTVGVYAINSLAMSPDGKHLYVPGEGLLYVVDSSLKTETVSIKITDESDYLKDVGVSLDGKYVYVLGNEAVFVVSTKSKAVVATVPGFGIPTGLAVSPDGKYVYVTEALNNVVSAINTSTYCVDFSVDAGRSPQGVAVSPDGGCLYVFNSYVGSSDGKVSVVKLDSSVGFLGVERDSFGMWWLLVVGVCVIVVSVIVFLLVMRIKRKLNPSVLVDSDVNNNALIKPMLFSLCCVFV